MRKEKEEEEEIRKCGDCGLYMPIMPSCLIQANETKHQKQAISAIGANDQQPTAVL